MDRPTHSRHTVTGRAARLAVLAAVACLAITLVGCGGDSGDEAQAAATPGTTAPSSSPTGSTPRTPTTAPTTSASTASPPRPEPTRDLPPLSSEPVNVTHLPGGVATLVRMRSAHHEEGGGAYDRLVLEFTGGLPGYSAMYVEEVFTPGAGEPIPLEGQKFFELVVHPAAMHDDDGRTTLRGPSSGGGHPAMVEYTVAGDFEGYVHIGIGLDDVVGFRIIELTGPDRIVIDFAA